MKSPHTATFRQREEAEAKLEAARKEARKREAAERAKEDYADPIYRKAHIQTVLTRQKKKYVEDPVFRQDRRDDNRTRQRNKYRLKKGISLDAPINTGRRRLPDGSPVLTRRKLKRT